jgi:hypothetical protein
LYKSPRYQNGFASESSSCRNSLQPCLASAGLVWEGGGLSQFQGAERGQLVSKFRPRNVRQRVVVRESLILDSCVTKLHRLLLDLLHHPIEAGVVIDQHHGAFVEVVEDAALTGCGRGMSNSEISSVRIRSFCWDRIKTAPRD